jgi:hypothetical protein
MEVNTVVSTEEDAYELIDFLIQEVTWVPDTDSSQMETLRELFITALNLGAQQPEWAEALLKLLKADHYPMCGMSRQELARAVAGLEPVQPRAAQNGDKGQRQSQESPQTHVSKSRQEVLVS